MTNQLTQLKKMTVVVADTGDIDAIEQYAPEDATTNPSLLYKAAQMEQYSYLIDNAIADGKQYQENEKLYLDFILDNLAVNFGKEILKIVPGRISTEVDARLSFDQEATIKRARQLISLYEQAGIAKNRILIKIAATWEGIKAAEVLEKDGINCNLTLLFGFCQAVACAEAGVFLISPFVGRILDWYNKNTEESYTAETDPGVLSVAKIYAYYKKFGYSTVVMGASFRNIGEILQLAGCDRLTIGPNFLEELQQNETEVKQLLSKDMVTSDNMEKIHLDEKAFRWLLNEDTMATEKLAEGIRNFSKDIVKLEDYIKSRL
ncbi:MAG: transaldolase [Deltaproteobacteria bacterium]|jgi:transaldolase|nr:transaldolase [Deltaproteobacteria bacterium]MBT4525825.1 transaldolase [Deltaproteobacteria bacterium]